MATELKLGLLGLGVVGGGVYQALRERPGLIGERCGRPVSVKRALVRDLARARSVVAEQGIVTDNPSDILDDPEIGLVVEVLGGEEPARAYAMRAIAAGKHVVTANKEMVAKHGAELLGAARERGLQFGFEASVGGGIPIIAALRRNLVANRLTSVRGIVNGTTNYILSEMEDKGRDFAVALREAQELGYAEPDPTNDVEGFDARYKLVILCALAFGSWPRPDEITCEGITRLAPADFHLARELGFAIKLLAFGQLSEKGLEARVQPTLTPLSNMLAGVKGVFNAVQVQGDMVGDMVFYGRGAGPGPTASAILADVVGIARGEPAPSFVRGPMATVVPPNEVVGRYYLRLPADDPTIRNLVSERLMGAGVAVATMNAAADGGALAILTEECPYAAVALAVAQLANAAAGPQVAALLPVLI